jgi:hypothetical protein
MSIEVRKVQNPVQSDREIVVAQFPQGTVWLLGSNSLDKSSSYKVHDEPYGLTY